MRDGFSPQTNIVRKDGARGVLLSVLKNGGASTLDIVANLKALLPHVQSILPGDIKVTPLFDQSVFVKAAVQGVVSEALIAAALTALMVLLFLGNWRSTLIIALTIPLSILASILVLQMLGETLNLMTLGGLALSVGILVDQAIVTIENIERHLHLGKPLDDAIVVGAGEIGVPAFVSTLVHLHRLRADVLPLRRRALPVRAAGRGGRVRDDRVVHPVAHAGADARDAADARLARRERRAAAAQPSLLQRVYRAFDRQFERVRGAYTITLVGAAREARRLRRRASSPSACSRAASIPFLGRDFFPSVDAGQIRLHMRAATGTRIEETARLADDVEAAIRELVPKDQLETILDNLGVPNSGINLSYSNAGTIGTLDGEIQLSLKEGHRPTAEFVTLLRAELPKRFPGIEFFFQPADIVTQILNFGLPAAIDVQLTGNDMRGQRRDRRRARQADRADPRRGRRARAPAARRAGRQPADGPHPAAADGPVGAERRPERAGLALGQLADGAGVLAQPGQRHRLLDRRAGAAVPRRFARRAAQRAGRRNGGPARRPAVNGTAAPLDPAARQPRRGDARRASRRSSRATTSCRRSTST